MEKSDQYKGIFYNNKTTHKYYEGGAHFSYNALIKILTKMKDYLNKDRREVPKEEHEEGLKINIPKLSTNKSNRTNSVINNNINKNLIFNNLLHEHMKKVSPNKINKNEYSRNKVTNHLNMPKIYNTRNISDKILGGLNETKNKFFNIKMNSTIGFNEGNKIANLNIVNNIMENKISRNKKNNSIKIFNNFGNSTQIVDKINSMYNKKDILHSSRNMKLYNINNIDYNISNYKKINDNYNNKNINKNNKLVLQGKGFKINRSREKLKMNMSIFNFSVFKKKHQALLGQFKNK